MYNISIEPIKSTIALFFSCSHLTRFLFLTDIPHKNTLLFVSITFLILYGSNYE